MKIVQYFLMVVICSINQLGFTQNSYTVKKVNKPIVIDGQLEGSWDEAPNTEYFVNLDSTTAPVKTTAKMLWDNKYLYLAIVCEDSSVWSDIEKRDGPLWDQDVIEIFIDPDGDGKNYIEVGIAPNGTICDILMSKSYFEGGTYNLDYNIQGLICKSVVEGNLNSSNGSKQWICEVAIPFKGFPSKQLVEVPRAGYIWRVNICRMDKTFNGANAGLFSWNYLGGRKFKNGSFTFHNPEKFGYIIFDNNFKNSHKKRSCDKTFVRH